MITVKGPQKRYEVEEVNEEHQVIVPEHLYTSGVGQHAKVDKGQESKNKVEDV